MEEGPDDVDGSDGGWDRGKEAVGLRLPRIQILLAALAFLATLTLTGGWIGSTVAAIVVYAFVDSYLSDD